MGGGEEGGVRRREKNENSPSQGELSGGVRALGAGRTGLSGSQGRPETPGAARGRPGAKTEKGGLEKGGIVSVCLRGGGGLMVRNKINAVKLRGLLETREERTEGVGGV